MNGAKVEAFIVAVVLLLMFASGCTAPLSPAAKAAIADSRNQAAIATEKAKEAAAAADAAAKSDPAKHPIRWLELIMNQVRGPLIVVGSVATLAFLVGLGFIFASFFSALAPGLRNIGLLVAPISAVVAAGSWCTLAFLPIAPEIIGGCAALALVLFLVQLAHAKWNIANLFGLHEANTEGIKAAAAGKPLPPMDKPILPPTPAVPIPAVPIPAVPIEPVVRGSITELHAATGSQDAPIVG